MKIDDSTLTLEESVYLRLSEEILSGELVRGHALTESHLCSKYNASRTPIRAAIHRLAEEGLVKCVPNRGAVVEGIDKMLLYDIYQIRMRLEGLSASLSALRISDSELESLTNTVELSEFYAKKKDTENLRQLDSKFHEIIYRSSGNRMLEKTLCELHRIIKSYRKKSLSVSDRLFSSVKEHREILEAIKEKDSQRADELTSTHVKRAFENISKIYE
jgi:DNA-binding GntR family transcriptional regulator